MQGDVVVDKENVGPRGSGAWSQQAMLAKNKGLGVVHEAVRKEKSSILASNATTNNGGGAAGLGSLELLKERVKLLKLSSTNGSSGDSGSRLLKHRSALADIKCTEGTVNSSVGSFPSKDGTGHLTAQDRSSSQSREIDSLSKLSHSRASSSEHAERNVKSTLHLSGGQARSKSHWSGSLKVLELYQDEIAKSRDRREASRSRVEAWVNAVGQTPEDRRSTSPVGFVVEQHLKASQTLGTTQHQLESKTRNPQSSGTSKGSDVWSGAKRQGTPYNRRLPLLEEGKVGKIVQEDETQSKNGELRVAGHAAAVSLKLPKHRDVEYFEARDKENKVGVRTSSEDNLKHFSSHSVDRVSERRTSECSGSEIWSSEDNRSVLAADIYRGALSEKIITFSESIKLTRSSGVWGHSEAVFSSQGQREESFRCASFPANTDATTVAASTSFLLSKMSGSSSSGSSATPGLSGGSTRDDDTVGYLDSSKKQTPSSREHVMPSSRERMSSRTRISKRLKALGPASRLLISGPALRVAVEDGSSASKNDGSTNSVILSSPEVMSSPLDKEVACCLKTLSPITPEEAQIFPDADLLGDFKKRKAEDDPSIGDVSQGENGCTTENKSPCDREIQLALPSVSDLFKGVHRNHLVGLKTVLPRENHRLLPGLGKVEDRGTRLPTLQREAESTNGDESQPAKRTSFPNGSSDLAPNSKGVSKKINIHDVCAAASQVSMGTPEKPSSGLSSSQNFDNMVSLQQGQLLDRHVPPLNQPIDGAGHSVNSSMSSLHIKPKCSPSWDAQHRSSEADGSRVLSSKKAASDVKEGSEALSMSQDGLSPRDRSDTRPGSVLDLSNSLGSLSIGERDVQTKTQSSPPLQNLVNNSFSNPPVVPENQCSIKSLDNVGVPNTSHSSGRSAVTTENEPPFQHSRSLPSENTRKEPSGASKETDIKEEEVKEILKTAPSEKPEAATFNVQRPGEDPRKLDIKGCAVPNQRKVLEDEKFFWVNDERYQKLGMIGKGGSSEVYKVIDREFSIYALKKIILGGRDHSTARGFYQEIEYLERLRGKRHIVQLIDYEVTNGFVVEENYVEDKIQEDACIYMVLEFGEIDLAGILVKRRKEMLESNEPLDDNWIRFYWKHMLSAVKTIHDERIVHADLKPANFLLVKGELKLIDFGIAKAIQTDTTHVVRDSQVGTLNYMPPESLMNNSKDEDGRVFKCGRSSDIWSLGCILYQMVYGHTPYSHVRTMFAKIQAITSKSFKIAYPPIRDPWLLDVMKRCLTWDRHSRPDIAQLLVHPFLRPDLAPYK